MKKLASYCAWSQIEVLARSGQSGWLTRVMITLQFVITRSITFILCSSTALYAQDNTASVLNKALVCTACHGNLGVSINPEWPNIAGQNENYFKKQINDIKLDKQRHAPTMTAIINSLSPDDIDVLAAYYAKMPIAQGSTPQTFVARGEQLYRGGDFDKHITACIACHGPKGTGNASAGFPALSGQHAAYTEQQLQAFKDSKRTNDLNHIMQDICAKMSKEDMEAVAHYIEGLY